MAFTNDGSFFEQFQRMQQRTPQAPEAEVSTSEEQPSPLAIDKGQAFAAAARFSTAQPGYYFGTGVVQSLPKAISLMQSS